MNFSGLGGIAIALIAGTWLLVLLPRWADGVRSDAQPAATRQPPTEHPELGYRGRRLKITNRFAKALTVACAFVVVMLVGLSNANPNLLIWLTAVVPFAALAAWLTVMSNRILKRMRPAIEVSKPRVRVDLKTQLSKAEPAPPSIFNQRAWLPSALPEPLNNRLGQLRQHAPVVSFEQIKLDAEINKSSETPEAATTTEINVTEILKRRRVI